MLKMYMYLLNISLSVCRLIQKSQSELTQDVAEKQIALGMDRSAFKLRNTSRGLDLQNGIENFDNTYVSVHIMSNVLFCFLLFLRFSTNNSPWISIIITCLFSFLLNEL